MNNNATTPEWHTSSVKDVAALLQTNIESGLSSSNVRQRLLESGYNEIIEGRKRSALSIFASQFTDFMILILIV